MFVTTDKFDESKVVFKPIVKHTEPVPYQRIPIKYMYDGEEKPLLIRTHSSKQHGTISGCPLSEQALDPQSAARQTQPAALWP